MQYLTSFNILTDLERLEIKDHTRAKVSQRRLWKSVLKALCNEIVTAWRSRVKNIDIRKIRIQKEDTASAP